MKRSRIRKRMYSVIGLYEDTGEILNCLQWAANAEDAVRMTAREVSRGFIGPDDTVQILCAIRGAHFALSARQGSGRAASVAALIDSEVPDGTYL